MVTISEIFNVLSDDKSLMLFNAIACGSSEELLRKANVSEEHPYHIISTLLSIGLVRKQDDKYFVSSIGRIFYHAYLNLSSGMDNMWKLKWIDILEESDKMPREELSRIINTVIRDHKIREIIKTCLLPLQDVWG
jgi:predicted transcriptional regulator